MGVREDIERIKTGIGEAKAELKPLGDAYYTEKSITREEYDERMEAVGDRIAELNRERKAIWFDSGLSRADLDVVMDDIQEFRDELAEGLASWQDVHSRTPRKVHEGRIIARGQLVEELEELGRTLLRVQVARDKREVLAEDAMALLRPAVSDGVLTEETLERLRPYLLATPPG